MFAFINFSSRFFLELQYFIKIFNSVLYSEFSSVVMSQQVQVQVCRLSQWSQYSGESDECLSLRVAWVANMRFLEWKPPLFRENSIEWLERPSPQRPFGGEYKISSTTNGSKHVHRPRKSRKRAVESWGRVEEKESLIKGVTRHT